MDALAGIAKITGIVLLVWTGHSIFSHFTHRNFKTILCHDSVKSGTVLQGRETFPKDEKKGSMTEHLLNNLLLYLWFIFLLSFSIGLIVNN
jgi:hypothetical protein